MKAEHLWCIHVHGARKFILVARKDLFEIVVSPHFPFLRWRGVLYQIIGVRSLAGHSWSISDIAYFFSLLVVRRCNLLRGWGWLSGMVRWLASWTISEPHISEPFDLVIFLSWVFLMVRKGPYLESNESLAVQMTDIFEVALPRLYFDNLWTRNEWRQWPQI